MGKIKIRNRDNETREQLSKLAGVGERTYGKATAILNSDNEEIK